MPIQEIRSWEAQCLYCGKIRLFRSYDTAYRWMVAHKDKCYEIFRKEKSCQTSKANSD